MWIDLESLQHGATAKQSGRQMHASICVLVCLFVGSCVATAQTLQYWNSHYDWIYIYIDIWWLLQKWKRRGGRRSQRETTQLLRSARSIDSEVLFGACCENNILYVRLFRAKKGWHRIESTCGCHRDSAGQLHASWHGIQTSNPPRTHTKFKYYPPPDTHPPPNCDIRTHQTIMSNRCIAMYIRIREYEYTQIYKHIHICIQICTLCI